MRFVHRIKPCITIIQNVRFFPGMNTLSDGEFEIIAETKAFKEEIECGNMSIGGHIESARSEAPDAGDDIKKRSAKLSEEIRELSISQAREVIRNQNDAYTLRAIREMDGRKGVSEAVDNRLADINNQVGSDLTQKSIAAPEGSGSDLIGCVSDDAAARHGTTVSTAIPALKKHHNKGRR